MWKKVVMEDVLRKQFQHLDPVLIRILNTGTDPDTATQINTNPFRTLIHNPAGTECVHCISCKLMNRGRSLKSLTVLT